MKRMFALCFAAGLLFGQCIPLIPRWAFWSLCLVIGFSLNELGSWTFKKVGR